MAGRAGNEKAPAGNVVPEAVKREVRERMKELEPAFQAAFRYLHQHPELSFQEVETTRYIKKKLLDMGVEVLDIGADTGVVGLLRGGEDGPCIGLRADIDALPIQEASTSPFPSKNDGIMHACGHDVHMTCLLGAAAILSRLRDQIHGSVKFIFEPGEEAVTGSRYMLDRGVLDNPRVDALFGLHNQPLIPSGTVSVHSGPLMAGVDRIHLTITGKGGHGGIPQKNRDPIVAASSFILAAQTIVSRNLSPLDAAVLSICYVNAGSSQVSNVTPESVEMAGTVRTFRSETSAFIEKRLRTLVEEIAAAFGCEGELEYIHDHPFTYDLPALVPAAREAVLGCGAQPIDPEPITASEDFSVFERHVPAYFYWLGTGNEEKDCVYAWHSPHFKADTDILRLGAGTYALSVFTGIEAVKRGLPDEQDLSKL